MVPSTVNIIMLLTPLSPAPAATRAKPRLPFRLTGLLLSLCGCFGFSRSGLGWNGEGHMVVAQMAYNHLYPAVKAQCDALIAVPLPYASAGTSNFVTAACWADDFKSQLGTGIWHYLDLPFSLDGTLTNSFVPASFDVVQAINLCISTLGSSTSAQTNRATYPALPAPFRR